MLTFGTDGVRGLANAELTPEFALALGRAAARVLGGDHWVVGRDTRRSGPLLEAALTAGLAAEGVDVELLGVVPTPAVAHVSADHGVPGAVISASHNHFADNGIKLFAPGGAKLTDEVEGRIETELHTIRSAGVSGEPPTGLAVGTVIGGRVDLEAYERHVVDTLGGRSLEGLSVVLDCGHGAASSVAEDVFGATGADVTVLNAEPDGANINDGVGSTDPSGLAAAVLEQGADVGLAFDGDADRVIAVDETGQVVDGDHLIALCATALRRRGELDDDTVVVTVMSNLGFRRAMEREGIHVVETPVGDRHVLEALAAGGYSLGGEQSGHVIFRRFATTGDGMLTGLQLLDLVHTARRPLSELAHQAMTRLPQVLRNVRVADRDPGIIDALRGDIGRAEAELAERGRVLVRPSGTEPLIRVMVEADEAATAERVADDLVAAVERTAGRPS